jgi:hypothetical protein
MYFQALQSQTETSPLNVSKALQEDDKFLDMNLTENEIQSHVYLSLLDSLDYIKLNENKFLILGACLMRKFSDKHEMLTVLLFELLRTNNLTGQFMNPPEKPLLKASNNIHYMEDDYIVQSLRKSSEEIRKKPFDESEKQTTPKKQ